MVQGHLAKEGKARVPCRCVMPNRSRGAETRRQREAHRSGVKAELKCTVREGAENFLKASLSLQSVTRERFGFFGPCLGTSLAMRSLPRLHWPGGGASAVTSAYSGDHRLPAGYARVWGICTGQGSVQQPHSSREFVFTTRQRFGHRFASDGRWS